MKFYTLLFYTTISLLTAAGCGQKASFSDSMQAGPNQSSENREDSTLGSSAASEIDTEANSEILTEESQKDSGSADATEANPLDNQQSSSGSANSATTGQKGQVGNTSANNAVTTTGAAVAKSGTGGGTDTGSNPQAKPTGVPKTVTAAELALKCATSAVVSKQQLLSFPVPTPTNPNDTCSWNVGGNIGQIGAAMTARLEQNAQLTIPDNALLCSLSLDFIPEKTAGQKMRYDDEIFLTFNNVIIAASQSYENVFSKQDGFLLYDWSKLLSKPYAVVGPTVYPVYCVDGANSCMIPPTQTEGIMSVTLGDSTVQKIAASTGIKIAGSDSLKGKSEFKFSFITTGDNDPTIDCMHSQFDFQATAKYVTFD